MLKLKNIEFLRTIFMFAVVWTHLMTRLAKHVPMDIYNYFADHSINGGKSVEAFFIISGFLLILTFKNTTSVIDFIKKKIIRLTPVIIWGTIIAAVAGIFKIIHFSFPAAIFTVSFTNIIVGIKTLQHWNYLQVTWYVSAMFWVLLLYFYLIKIFDNKYTNLIIGICTFASYFLCLHLNKGIIGSPHAMYYNIFNIGMLRAIGGIGIGYFLGIWYKNYITSKNFNRILSRKEVWIYTFLELTFLIICILELFILKEKCCYNFSIVIYLIILILLFILQKGYISRFFNKDWCVEIGKYSYPIYVVHTLIYTILQNIGFISVFGKFAIIPTIFIPIIFGIFTYYVVEKPCTNYFKNNRSKTVATVEGSGNSSI